MGFGVWVMVAVAVVLHVANAKEVCPGYTSKGCSGCVQEDWLDGFKHCGWCNDAGGSCMDGSEGGPFEGSCSNWEWYGKGGVGGNGGQCCSEAASCSDCLDSKAGCAFCPSENICVEKETVPASFCNRTSVCCDAFSSCDTCNGQSGCGWCGTSGSCVTTQKLQDCPVPADAQCCNVENDCSSCRRNTKCNWCDGPQSVCTPLGACPAGTAADKQCCVNNANCEDCNGAAGVGCGWCSARSMCTTRDFPCKFAGRSCCEALSGCQPCNADTKCEYCIQRPVEDSTCVPKGTCPNPADQFCCNVDGGLSCDQCVGMTGCSFCTDSRSCTSGSCKTLNVGNSTAWQCNNPIMLNCEAMTSCVNCVDAPGCVWIDPAWVNGKPQKDGLCFTGGLFSLHESQVPGFVVTAPFGWYYGTCSIPARTIVILSGSFLAAALLAIGITICLCVWWRKKKMRERMTTYSTLNDSSSLLDSAPPTVIGDVEPKRKKRVAKPVKYNRPDRVTNTNTSRYLESRRK